MKFLPLYLNKTSMRLLILLMAVHFIGTIVAYAIYAKLASLGDGYLPKDYLQAVELNKYGEGFSRSRFVHAIYYYIGNFLPGFLDTTCPWSNCSCYNLACFQKCLFADQSSTFLAL